MNYWINSTIPSISSTIPWRSRQGHSPSRRNWAGMNPGLAALGGLGLGAGLMFIFDPVRGRRRRALLRDQLVHAGHLLARATHTTSRDVSHRAYGMLAEGSHLFQHDEVSDEVLPMRVRARLGHSVSHPHAISVTVNNGRVTLSGPVLATEVDRLLSGVSSVRGVKGIDNALTVHTRAEGVPSLQGGRPRTGDRFALMQSNWSPTARLLTVLGGGALIANCLARRDPVSMALSTVGFGLLMRGATNMEMKSLLGVGHDCRPIEVQKTININAPVERVFEYWTNYQNFPHFMSNVREVRPTGTGRSHWVVAGPAGVPIEWTAEITEMIPNKLLAWRSIEGSVIDHTGVIHFEPNHNGGTRVHIKLCYQPLIGAIGHTLAKIFGSDPKSEMDADLVRMKTYIETGRLPHDAANPLPERPETTFTHAKQNETTVGQLSNLAGGP
jgi:uncharacterized membrane protein